MRRGFTLIELIVVIIIVGILASIGLTQYTKMVEKGRASEARVVLGSLRTAQIAYNFENAEYTDVIPNLGVDAQDACADGTHYFVYTCAAATGTCTATRCIGGTGKAPSGTIAYTKTLDIAGTFGGSQGY